MTDLAKRAVASPHWRWMPGMRRLTFDGGHLYPSRVADDGTYPGGLFPVPDLEDPATLGCLLSLVREAHAPAHWLTTAPLMTAGGVHGWRVQGLDGPVCATEAEALVAALEAAP